MKITNEIKKICGLQPKKAKRIIKIGVCAVGLILAYRIGFKGTRAYYQSWTLEDGSDVIPLKWFFTEDDLLDGIKYEAAKHNIIVDGDTKMKLIVSDSIKYYPDFWHGLKCIFNYNK